MIATDYCEACGLEGQRSQNAGPAQRVRVTCKRCGTFEWEPIAAFMARPVTSGRRVRLSAFVREQNAAGITPLLRPEVIRQVERRPLPRLQDRALRALSAMVREVDMNYPRRSLSLICCAFMPNRTVRTTRTYLCFSKSWDAYTLGFDPGIRAAGYRKTAWRIWAGCPRFSLT